MSDMLKAAKLSLAAAEECEHAHDGVEAFDRTKRRPPIEEMRDELLLGILQSNIAIAEALTRDECEPDPWPDPCSYPDCDCMEAEMDLCRQDCDCCDEPEEEWACEPCEFDPERTEAIYVVPDRDFLATGVRFLIHWDEAA